MTSTFVTPVSGPYVTSVVPAHGTSGGSANAKFIHNVPINLSTGTHNFYLYKEADHSLISTIPSTSSRVTLTSNDTVSINLRDLIQVGYAYYITTDTGIFYDIIFNFPSVAITDDSKYLYTPTSATLITVIPTFNTSSATNNVKLIYDRDIYAKSTGTFHVYEADIYSPTNPLIISTIPSTSTRISFAGSTVTLDLKNLTVPGGTYWIMAPADTLRDELNYPLPKIDDWIYGNATATIIKWAPIGAGIVSTNPPNGQSEQFYQNVSITYDRPVTANTSGYVHVYNDTPVSTATGYTLHFKDTSTIKTYAGTSTSIVFTGNTVNITFDNFTMKEGNYYITNDAGVARDNLTLPIPAISTSTVFGWYNTILSNMTSRAYVVNSATSVFTTSTPIVLDPDTGTTFTLSLTSGQGIFDSSLGGTLSTSSVWSYSGTRSQINTIIPTIKFNSSFTATSINTFTYSLVKGSTVLVNRSLPLIGSIQPNSIPMTISLSPSPGYQGENFNIVLYSTSTFDLSGTSATIYINGNTLTNVTFVGDVANTATTSINATGTEIISAIYYGGSIPGNWVAPSFSPSSVTETITWHTLNTTPTLTASTSLYSTIMPQRLVMNLNTSSNFTGTVTYFNGGTIFSSTGTMFNSTNTLTINPGILNVGTYTFTSTWNGLRNVPYYFPKEASSSQTFSIINSLKPTIKIDVSSYYNRGIYANQHNNYNNYTTSSTGTIIGVSIFGPIATLTNTLYNFPDGIVTLEDITNYPTVTTLGTGTVYATTGSIFLTELGPGGLFTSTSIFTSIDYLPGEVDGPRVVGAGDQLYSFGSVNLENQNVYVTAVDYTGTNKTITAQDGSGSKTIHIRTITFNKPITGITTYSVNYLANNNPPFQEPVIKYDILPRSQGFIPCQLPSGTRTIRSTYQSGPTPQIGGFYDTISTSTVYIRKFNNTLTACMQVLDDISGGYRQGSLSVTHDTGYTFWAGSNSAYVADGAEIINLGGTGTNIITFGTYGSLFFPNPY